MRHYPEIVKVLDETRLIDSESYEHAYWTAKPRTLAAGYYIVSWSDAVLSPRFDERAYFSGPFRNPTHARLALERQLDGPYRRSA